MPANLPVREAMTSEVLSFRATDDVRAAMQALVDRGVDGAPVIDGDGKVVGVITTGDLIVKQSRLHFPTVIAILGAAIELKPRGFDHDLEKALGSKVGDVMSSPAITVDADGTVEDAATIMHEERVSRLPVVRNGQLVGIVSRVDVLRGMLTDR